MKNTIKLCLLLILFGSCEMNNERTMEAIKNSSFNLSQISKGNNNPNINASKDSLDLLLTALHYRIPIKEIEKGLKWSHSKMNKKTDLLLKNGFIKESYQALLPTICILPFKEGELLIQKSQKIAQEIADSIKIKLPEVKALHSEMSVSKQFAFQDLSFFYLSDILLDMGQINNVEKDFLKSERPLRNGKRFYSALLQRDSISNTEPFGICGNQGLLNNDSIYIAVYGNTRMPSNLGWTNYQDKQVYHFNKKDFDYLFNQMPEVFRKTLVSILNDNKPYFNDVYKELEYDKEITFNEFFIWWYHIIYSETTNILINENIIKKPEKGLIYYTVEK